MKRHVQITDSHCGPATVCMLLSIHEIDVSQEEIVQKAGITHRIEEHGSTVQQLAAAVHEIAPHLSFWYKTRSTFEDIDVLVNTHKKAVGVEWQGVFEEFSSENYDDDGHYSVVTNIDLAAETITIADPYGPFSEKDRVFPLAQFRPRWWDVNEVDDPDTGYPRHIIDERMIFVITTSDELFPQELGMIKF